MKIGYLESCTRCGAGVGELHEAGCTVEQCPYCGGQLLSCYCPESDDDPAEDRVPWGGLFPGESECQEFGWYARRAGGGWKPCGPGVADAIADLNRLRAEAVWDRGRKRF